MIPEGGGGLLLHSSCFCSCTCEDMCAIYEIVRHTFTNITFLLKFPIIQFVAIPRTKLCAMVQDDLDSHPVFAHKHPHQ
jgi:hypothetical protein